MAIKSSTCPSDKAKAFQEALGRVLKSLVFHGGPPPWVAELPVSQLRCWYQIAENEGLRMHDLAESMGVKLPAISQIVDRLVRRSLVERKTDPLDRRAVCLYLTDDTRVKHLESKAAHLARLAETSSKLSPDSLEALISGLNELADAAETLNAAARPGKVAGRSAERKNDGRRRRQELDRRIGRFQMSPEAMETVK